MVTRQAKGFRPNPKHQHGVIRPIVTGTQNYEESLLCLFKNVPARRFPERATWKNGHTTHTANRSSGRRQRQLSSSPQSHHTLVRFFLKQWPWPCHCSTSLIYTRSPTYRQFQLVKRVNNGSRLAAAFAELQTARPERSLCPFRPEGKRKSEYPSGQQDWHE